MKDVVILIPTFNPNHKLVELIKDIKDQMESKIIVVNDGSDGKHQKIFGELTDFSDVFVIGYQDNHGKGYALKYGINYYLEHFRATSKGLVTVDADYEHEVDDICNVALRLLGNQDSLILGTRNFDSTSFATKITNKFTNLIFNFLYGLKLTDTQTGLRGIPNRYLNLALEAKGKRFDYEMDMLIKFIHEKINVLMVPIKTINHPKKKSVFFRIIDIFLIYKILFTEYIKYGLTSLCAAIIDIIIFTAFLTNFNTIDNNLAIILGTVIARVISSFVNFNLTKYLVFDSHEKSEKIIGKFYLLTFCNMIASASLVLLLHNLFPNILESFFKVIVDTSIYFIGYKIQKKYIFKA